MSVTYDFNDNLFPASMDARLGTFSVTGGKLYASGSEPLQPRWVATFDFLADCEVSAIVNANNSNSDASGVVVRYSDNNNMFSATIYHRAANLGDVQLFKRESGVWAIVGSVYNIPSFSATQDYKIGIIANGTSLSVTLDDVIVIDDVPAQTLNLTSSKVGVRFGETGVSIDDLSASPLVSDSLTITTPNYIFKKKLEVNQDITIEGTYVGSPTKIEYSLNGGSFSDADASPSGGVFSHNLNLPTGQHSVVYRFSNDTDVSDSLSNIAVSEVIACAGQSNMVGWLGSSQTFSDSSGGTTAYLFGNDDNYKQLSDPYDISTNQVDSVSDDGANPHGSWVVRFANSWLSNSDTPVSFIPCAKGGSSVQEWQKDDTTTVVSGLNLYGSMSRRINAVGGVSRVFYQQGERDCRDDVQTQGSVYKAKLKQFCDDVLADFGANTYIIPLHNISRSNYLIETATTGQSVIRSMQIELAEENDHITIAPPLTDIDLSSGDQLHFETDYDLNLVAERVYSLYNQSTLNMLDTNTPDGTYSADIYNNITKTLVETRNITFSSGDASETIPLDAGAEILVFIEGSNPPVTGLAYIGVTE